MNFKNTFCSVLVLVGFTGTLVSKKFPNLTVANDASIGGNLHAHNNLRVTNNLYLDSLTSGIVQIVDGHLLTSDVLPAGSVDTTQLVDGSVTTAQIADSAVTLAKLQQPLAGDVTISGNLVFEQVLNVVGSETEVGLTLVRGAVAADGTILSGQGFTVNKTGTGTYEITFTNAFTSNQCYQVIAQISDNNHHMGFLFVDNIDESNCTVTTYQTPSNTFDSVLTDRIFRFIVIGN